jgi:hypothetical protein
MKFGRHRIYGNEALALEASITQPEWRLVLQDSALLRILLTPKTMVLVM